MESGDSDQKEKIYDHNSLKHLIESQKNITLDRGVEDVTNLF